MPAPTTSRWWCPPPAPATVAAGDKATFAELDELTAPQIRRRRHWSLGFGSHSSAPAAVRAPEVLSRVRLGPLEATTLAGGDLPGLQEWLADNGYSIRPAVEDALGPYVRDGWSFVSLRLTSAVPIVGGLDPVKMTFPSARLVYPMRLSVAATSPQLVTVFTLADHRQQRTDADADVAAQSTEIQYAGNVVGALNYTLLRELAADRGSYLTKVRVDIPQPSRISSDFGFGDAPNDAAYRQVIVVDQDVDVPIALIPVAGFLFNVIVATVVVLVLRRRRA